MISKNKLTLSTRCTLFNLKGYIYSGNLGHLHKYMFIYISQWRLHKNSILVINIWLQHIMQCLFSCLLKWKILIIYMSKQQQFLRKEYPLSFCVNFGSFTYFIWLSQPCLGGSVVSVSDSWPGGCEFDPRLRQLFFPAYFRLSTLQKHVRKVVGGFGKKSSVSTAVRKPENTYASLTAMIWP